MKNSHQPSRFLIRHLGNMGDHVFLIPPVLATLKRHFPNCHITLVTAWGYKDTRGKWGKRNQGGFCVHLMQTNPHVDRLVHYHDTALSLEGNICREDGQRFPTWNRAYYEQQKTSGEYDGIYELDFGLAYDDNPIQRMYQAIGMPDETYSKYELHVTASDRAIAETVTRALPRPRIVLLEGIEGRSTRGWDPGKIPALERAITSAYGVAPFWFGSHYVPEYRGRLLTLRENIATLSFADVAIGVMSGPLHFAVAVGTPTLTLYADHPLHRAAPAYFLNQYIPDPRKHHRTLLGPSAQPYRLLKGDTPDPSLTPAEAATQQFQTWQNPGRQSTKTGLAVLTVDEVMTVLNDMISI